MDVECHIPKVFEEEKAIIKENAYMKFYDETKPIYIETDASKVQLGAAILQTRDTMSCHRDDMLDNSILRPIAFTSKSFTGVEKRYSNIKRGALGILYGLEKSLLLFKEGNYNHGPQATHFHIQEKCSHIVTKTPANSIKKYISTGTDSYTNLDQTYSWHTGYPDRTTMKTEIKKLMACQ